MSKQQTRARPTRSTQWRRRSRARAASPGPSFLFGALNQQVTATVTDATSGTAGSTLSAAANTTTAGEKTLNFNASDKAGNAATSTSCSYVVGYKFGGFTAPLPKSTVNTGSTLPVK